MNLISNRQLPSRDTLVWQGQRKALELHICSHNEGGAGQLLSFCKDTGSVQVGARVGDEVGVWRPLFFCKVQGQGHRKAPEIHIIFAAMSRKEELRSGVLVDQTNRRGRVGIGIDSHS